MAKNRWLAKRYMAILASVTLMVPTPGAHALAVRNLCTHTAGELVPAQTATCSTPLVEAHYECGKCGQWLKADGKTAASRKDCTHDTDPDHHAKQLEESLGDYGACGVVGPSWTCPDCGRIYLDPQGLTAGERHEFSEIVSTKGKPATCTAPAVPGGFECAKCGERFTGSEDISVALPHADGEPDPDMHSMPLTKTAGKGPTESLPGLKEHWTCSSCGGVFTDAKGKEKTTYADLVIPQKDEKNAWTAMRVAACRYDADNETVSFTVVVSGLDGSAQLCGLLTGGDGKLYSSPEEGLKTLRSAGGAVETVFTFPVSGLAGKEVSLSLTGQGEARPVVNVTESPAPSIVVPEPRKDPEVKTTILVDTDAKGAQAGAKVRLSGLQQGERYTLTLTACCGDYKQCRTSTFTAPFADCEKQMDFDAIEVSNGDTVKVKTQLSQGNKVLDVSDMQTVDLPVRAPEEVQIRNIQIETGDLTEDGRCDVTCDARAEGLEEAGAKVTASLTNCLTGETLDIQRASNTGEGESLSFLFPDVPATAFRGIPVGVKFTVRQGEFTHDVYLTDTQPVLLPQGEPVVMVSALREKNGRAETDLQMCGLESGCPYTVSAVLEDSETGQALDEVRQAAQMFVPDDEAYNVTLQFEDDVPRSREVVVRARLDRNGAAAADTDDNTGGSNAAGLPRLYAEAEDENGKRKAVAQDGGTDALVPGELQVREGKETTIFSEVVTYTLPEKAKGFEVCALLTDEDSGWPILADGVPAVAVTPLDKGTTGQVEMRIEVPKEAVADKKPQLKTTLLKDGAACADTDGGENRTPTAVCTSWEMKKSGSTQTAEIDVCYDGLEPGLTYMFVGTLADLPDAPTIAKPITALTSNGRTALYIALPGTLRSIKGTTLNLGLNYGDTVLCETEFPLTD